MLGVHVATALFAWSWGRDEGLWLLVSDRSPRLRVLVGGQAQEVLALGQYWRLLTSVLLHGDGLHLLVNASALWVLGRLYEPLMGGLSWLACFFFGGLVGSIAGWLLGVPASDGASGGAFALLGVGLYWGWFFRSRLSPEDRRLHGPVLQGLTAVNVVGSFLVPFIDPVAHVAGLGVGIAWGWLWAPREDR